MNLFSVYGQRIASNPHARNWQPSGRTLPKAFGNRRFRRKVQSLVRTGGFLA